jgi:DNA-binding transcriptional MerR regulator
MILSPPATATTPIEKGPEAYRTIREVADSMDLPQHVLRFWETRFPQIRPLKRAGGRRYYRPDDIERLRLIRRLLYDQGYTIKGVQKLFKEQGVQALSSAARPLNGPSAESASAGEPLTGSAKAAGVSGTASGLADNDLAALRQALVELVDAEQILIQARSLDS